MLQAKHTNHSELTRSPIHRQDQANPYYFNKNNPNKYKWRTPMTDDSTQSTAENKGTYAFVFSGSLWQAFDSKHSLLSFRSVSVGIAELTCSGHGDALRMVATSGVTPRGSEALNSYGGEGGRQARGPPPWGAAADKTSWRSLLPLFTI